MRRWQLLRLVGGAVFVLVVVFVMMKGQDKPESNIKIRNRRPDPNMDHPVEKKPRSDNKNSNSPSSHNDGIRGVPDSKHFHGNLVGKRESGEWSFKPVPYVSMAEETLEMKRISHTKHCFNRKRSDGIALDRDVPDYRSPKCKAVNYPKNLPKSSVVFVFFNEPLSPLLRSIHSVLNRTPPDLLHEIVIVDDGSDAPWLGADLEEHVKYLPKVKLVRMPERLGLMAARTRGAEESTAEIVVFLDSHIECTPGWLEPMVARIAEDKHHVVMPIIDSIDADSFDYHRGGLDILGFSWGLGQKSLGNRRRTQVEPMPSPIMAGGLFAMDRKLFFDLGAYDPEMRLYGGEEMEISFRIWQCGCTLECIPCSRVGHVFRTGQFWQGQVFTVPGEVIVKNKLRAAAVWMDEYQEIVQHVMPKLPPGMDLGPLDSMVAIREKYKCKPFKWFLENVYPEMFVPNDPDFVRASGEIRNPETGGCIDTLGARRAGSAIGVYPCHHAHGTQEFVLSKQGDIRVASMDFDNCLDRGGKHNRVAIYPCHGTGGNQQWNWDESTGLLSDAHGSVCLKATREHQDSSPLSLSTTGCNANDPGQKWEIQEP